MSSEEKTHPKISVPKAYSKAFEKWFWTCSRCEQKIRISLSNGSTEYSIKGERVCKPCMEEYLVSRTHRLYKDLVELRNVAQELGINHKPICGDEFLKLDTKSNGIMNTAIRFDKLAYKEEKALKEAIKKVKEKN